MSGSLGAGDKVSFFFLICLLGNVAHLGSDVAQQEEYNSCDTTSDLCYPEGHFPAMVLGNSAEW